MITFLELAESDLPLVHRWRNEAHVRARYGGAITSEEVAEKYLPRIRRQVPTWCHLALHDGRPFGLLQCYRVQDYPKFAQEIGESEGAAVDLLIGEPALLRKGFGRRMLRAYLGAVVFRLFPNAKQCFICHGRENAGARRCSEGAGFRFLREVVEDGQRSGLLVARRENSVRLGLGTWAFGGTAYGPMEDAAAIAVARRAYDLGIRFFDTAHLYAGGRSEEVLGDALEGRSDVEICTKLGYELRDGKAIKRYDPGFLDASLRTSLTRLRRDRVELLLLHNPPAEVLRDGGAFDWLNQRRTEGVIGAWGVSVYDSEADAQLAIGAGANAIEARYSLFRRDVIEAVRGRARFIARSPLEGGLLSGKFTGQETFARTDQRSAMPQETFERVARALQALQPLLDEGVADSYAEFALRFSAHGDGVSLTIPGAKSIEQLEANFLAVAQGPLPRHALDLIEKARTSFND